MANAKSDSETVDRPLRSDPIADRLIKSREAIEHIVNLLLAAQIETRRGMKQMEA